MTDDMNDFNQQIMDDFRANGGQVGGDFTGVPMVIVHHIGARSGIVRHAPLAYLPNGDDVVIFASKGGAPTNPDWYHNLIANPDTEIELGTEIVPVHVREAIGAEEEHRAQAGETTGHRRSRTSTGITRLVAAS